MDPRCFVSNFSSYCNQGPFVSYTIITFSLFISWFIEYKMNFPRTKSAMLLLPKRIKCPTIFITVDTLPPPLTHKFASLNKMPHIDIPTWTKTLFFFCQPGQNHPIKEFYIAKKNLVIDFPLLIRYYSIPCWYILFGLFDWQFSMSN